MRYNARQPTPELSGVLRTPEMAAYVTAAAEEGAEAVRAATPEDTGRLADSIRVEYGGERGGPRNDRCVAYIVAGDEDTDYAHNVNWGVRGRKGAHFMQAGVDALHNPRGRR